MGYGARDTARLCDDADRGVSRGGACSGQHIEELHLDCESIIFEMTPDGWCAAKLTELGWFRGRALTISDATAALSAQIRAALATR
jgi:hypothetical protein